LNLTVAGDNVNGFGIRRQALLIELIDVVEDD
jgi:hypothetical protein